MTLLWKNRWLGWNAKESKVKIKDCEFMWPNFFLVQKEKGDSLSRSNLLLLTGLEL